METNYPNLKRTKRKLCYLTNKESIPEPWTEPLTLADVDKMYDDLDLSHELSCDQLPPSPLLQMSETDTNLSERDASLAQKQGHPAEKLPRRRMGPEGDGPDPAARSPSLKLDNDLDIPFKAHVPVKTSSPIEKNMVVGGVEELDKASCEDDERQEEEERKTDPLSTQKPQCNGHMTEDYDPELESPPSKISLSKPKMSTHKNKADASCKENEPVKEKTAKRPKTPVLEEEREAPRQENADPPVLAAEQQPEVTAPKKKSESVQRQAAADVSARAGKTMTSFLQKLRDAGQPKAACSRKSLSPVKVPTPAPVLDEDDFLILEDDAPVWFSIPRKTTTSKKQRENRNSSSDKDSSADKGMKDSPPETAQKQQESKQTIKNLESQVVNQKMKKLKGKEKKNLVTESETDENGLSSPEEPAGDLMEQEKPNKRKQRLKKAPAKESNKAEERPEDAASRDTDEEAPTLKVEKKPQKSSDAMRFKTSKDGNENAKTSRAKSLKGGGKVMQRSDAGKESTNTVKKKTHSNKEHLDEDLASLSRKEIMDSEAQTADDLADEAGQESLSDNSHLLGKRKRRQTGQWWMSCPESTEDAKTPDNQPTLKRSKQNSAAAPSQTKKNKVLKRRSQTQPQLSPSHNTTKVKTKKAKQTENRNTRGDKQNKRKVTDEVFDVSEAEQDQDQDQEQSSPLVLTHRDHTHSSAPVSPRGSREQIQAAEPEKRRRKAPSNWWIVDGVSEDAEINSSQPRQQEPKRQKERKKPSKQNRSPRRGSPKNGNTAVSSKPQEGAPSTPQRAKAFSPQKSVKHSLATLKDIFTAATETPAAVSRRDAGLNNRQKVAERPVEEVASSDCSMTEKGILSIDAGQSKQGSPEDNKQKSDVFKALRSGPSSMIELEPYEENEDLLPSSRVHPALSVSDLCVPPLKPLVLQLKDKANLAEWFKSLWSLTVENTPKITPDHFDWYFYQGRAIGFLEDLNCGSICNGKILLGSYMKKPLWVDHSATTVFNLLTSSVSVTINGSDSRFCPGQSFMVPCGHAYSIQNTTAQPAVVYFTRIYTETSD